MPEVTPLPTRRGTTNTNDRGSTHNRRARRAWIITAWAADVSPLVHSSVLVDPVPVARCFRCGVLVFNPDDVHFPATEVWLRWKGAKPLSIDRVVPGCRGGTYARNNIRPACGTCNSETGGGTRK